MSDTAPKEIEFVDLETNKLHQVIKTNLAQAGHSGEETNPNSQSPLNLIEQTLGHEAEVIGKEVQSIGKDVDYEIGELGRKILGGGSLTGEARVTDSSEVMDIGQERQKRRLEQAGIIPNPSNNQSGVLEFKPRSSVTQAPLSEMKKVA